MTLLVKRLQKLNYGHESLVPSRILSPLIGMTENCMHDPHNQFTNRRFFFLFFMWRIISIIEKFTKMFNSLYRHGLCLVWNIPKKIELMIMRHDRLYHADLLDVQYPQCASMHFNATHIISRQVKWTSWLLIGNCVPCIKIVAPVVMLKACLHRVPARLTPSKSNGN